MFPRYLLGLLCVSVCSHAQLPLSIEELLVDDDVLKLETSFSYTNSEQLVQQLHWIPSPNAQENEWLPVTRLSTRDSDFSQLSTALRYGMSATTELSVRAQYTYVTWRAAVAQGVEQGGSGDLSSLTIGGTWLVSPENKTPALLLSMSVDVLDKGLLDTADTLYGKTGRIGFTTYRSIDPVVISVAAGYEYNAARELPSGEFVPGDQVYFVPQINFAVNHKITLIGGVGLRIRSGDKLNGHKVSRRSNVTDALLGLGFAPSGRSTIFLQSRFATGGRRSANISLDWLYQF